MDLRAALQRGKRGVVSGGAMAGQYAGERPAPFSDDDAGAMPL